MFSQQPSGVNSRVGKFLNFFSVVRFSNEACIGAGGLNGTCYTKDECRDRNGAATTSCAGQTPAPNTEYYDFSIRRVRSMLYLPSLLWWNIIRKRHLPHYRDQFGTGKWRIRRIKKIDLISFFSAFTRSAEQTKT